jgi:hypothetical protein
MISIGTIRIGTILSLLCADGKVGPVGTAQCAVLMEAQWAGTGIGTGTSLSFLSLRIRA